MKTAILVVAAIGIVAASCLAEELSTPVTGAQLVTCPGGGDAVVLSIARPEVPADVSLGDATLELQGAVLSETQAVRLHVRALSSSWAGDSDAPVYEGLVARLDVAAGAAAREVEVTNLVREILVEPSFAGFVITPAEQVDGGFGESDAQAVRAAFQNATLEIAYRLVPPPQAVD